VTVPNGKGVERAVGDNSAASTCSTYEILSLSRVSLMYLPGSDEKYVNSPDELN